MLGFYHYAHLYARSDSCQQEQDFRFLEEEVQDPRIYVVFPGRLFHLLEATWLLEAVYMLPETAHKLLGAGELPGP